MALPGNQHQPMALYIKERANAAAWERPILKIHENAAIAAGV
jgi:hypothetical protein